MSAYLVAEMLIDIIAVAFASFNTYLLAVLLTIVVILWYTFTWQRRQIKERNVCPKTECKPPTPDPGVTHEKVPSPTNEGFGRVAPISVNYHFTRKCNKACGFCFHTEKSSFVATEQDMKKGLQLLKAAGMRKINFAGGEPFLYPKELAMLCHFAKSSLSLESVSIITNGTKVTEEWLQANANHVDILGVSCDSFDETTNIKIGRGTGRNVPQLFRIRNWCLEFGIKFKLNTVVCRLNWEEDMSSIVSELNPFRWKCFQVLLVESENDAEEQSVKLNERRRNAKTLLVSDQQYQAFCDRHKHLESFVPECNEVMVSSYLILDEYLRFLDKGSNEEKQSSSILSVGVHKAMEEIKWDRAAFYKRGGVYEWSKHEGCHGLQIPEELQF